MAGPTAVWGIDVGRCALKAIRLRAGTEGRVDIIGQEYVEHSTILSKAEGNRLQLIADALERFLSRHDVSKDKVVVGVPGQHTLSRFSKLPPVEPKKIPDIVRYEADQQIPFDLDEVIWDYQTFQEEDSPDVEVGIFAMKRELIREHLLPFEQAGIEPVAVQAHPLALYNAMRFEDRLGDETVVLLDIGAENTDLVVASKVGLWTRTIPLGGSKFTDVLVKSFKLSFTKAENLKRTAASSKYARQIFQAMRPVFAELVQELSRSLGFYRSAHREAELKRVIGMGNAFTLPGLQKYLQQNLQMPIERPDTFKKANLVDVGDESEFKGRVGSFMLAYGLALQGLEISKTMPGAATVKSNLLPPEIVKQVVWRKKRPYFAAAAACLAVAAGTIWFRQLSDMSTLKSNEVGQVAQVNYERAVQILRTGPAGNLQPREQAMTWLEVSKALKREMDKYANKGSREQEKAQEIVQLQRNKAVWPKVLAAVHAALPKPRPELAAAETPEEYLAAIRGAGTVPVERGRRNRIFIEEFRSEYFDDLDAQDLLDVERGDSGADLIEKPTGQKRRGFIITMTCRTPNEGHLRYIDETIKKGLREHGRKPDAGFYINRVVLTALRGFTEKEDTSGTPPGRGRGRRRPPPSRRPTGPKVFDPVTDEDMSGDTVFEIQFDVVLADLPEDESKSATG